MRNAFCVLLLGALLSCSRSPVADPASQRRAAEPATAALRAGDFAGAHAAATTTLGHDPHNAVAAGVRALAGYQRAGSRLRDELVTALWVAGVSDDEALRGSLRQFVDALAAVDADLAIAADPSFALELCLACWSHDWNHSGEIDESDTVLFQIEVDADGEELAPDDPRRRPTFRFDVGDVHWARAMVAFQRGLLELFLAYKWRDFVHLLSGEEEVVTIRLNDPAGVQRATALVLSGLDEAERCRNAYLTESDDDREWMPAPRQKNHPVPLPVDQALYDTWAGVLGDVRRLVRGEEGLSLSELIQLGDHQWENPPGGYLDIGGILARPGDFQLSREHLDGIYEARGASAAEAATVARNIFGRALVAEMKKSPLVARLQRMRREIESDDDTFERKLRYFLWAN